MHPETVKRQAGVVLDTRDQHFRRSAYIATPVRICQISLFRYRINGHQLAHLFALFVQIRNQGKIFRHSLVICAVLGHIAFGSILL